MKPKRILIFSLVYYPRFVGGAEVAVKEITDRISPQEIVFDMVTMRTEKLRVEKIGNVNVHRVGWPVYNSSPKSLLFFLAKYKFMFWALRRALKLHREHKYDATWVIMANYASGPALFFKMLHRDVPMILTLQEGDPFSHIRKRVGILYPFFRKLFRVTDHVQAISQYLADWARSMGATCPVTVVPNGVDFKLFSEKISDDRRNELRRELGFGTDDIVLVTTSRLVKKNAVSDIIGALSFLDKRYKLLVIGSGEEEANLRQYADNLKVIGRVNFKGFIDRAKLPEYLQASDVFVRPSLSEGLGISFLEAMAAGIPVVATAVGGIIDFLIDGETGLVCEVNNPHSVAQKVEKVSKDRESRDFIVKRAREVVSEKFEWQGVAKKMREIFQR